MQKYRSVGWLLDLAIALALAAVLLPLLLWLHSLHRWWANALGSYTAHFIGTAGLASVVLAAAFDDDVDDPRETRRSLIAAALVAVVAPMFLAWC